MTGNTIVSFAAACAALSALAAPVLPGYLTDPSVMKSEMGTDKSYQTPDSLKFPYVSTEYVKPVVSPDETVEIGFFVTDFESSKVRFLDDSHQFAAFLELRPKGGSDWKRYVLKKLRSGNHAFKLGKLAAGDYELRVWAIDRQLRESHRVLHDFSVRENKAPAAGTVYEMTTDDLAKYKVRNDGNLSTILWEGENGVKTIREKNPKRPGYTVHVPLKGDKPVFRSFKEAKIDFDAGYDAAAVEEEATANVLGLQKLLDEKAAAGVRVLKLLPGTYRISAARPLEMPDDLTLDLNGATLKQNAFTGSHSVIVSFPSAKNARLENGTLEGDYYEHDYAGSPNNSEWPMGFNFSGSCEYCTVEKVKVVDITGYGAGNGIGKDRRGGLNYCYEALGKYVAGGLDPKTGALDEKDALRFTTDFRSLAKVKQLGRIQVSKYLGYQGRSTRSWQVMVCWYDAEKKFVSSETCWQYREMFIPAKAEFIRVSIEEESLDAAGKCGLVMTRFRVPTNCTVKDCTFERCRCVGYAASALKNMLFEGNFFTASGESAAKCAFDAEDGWDQMQDAYFLRNKFRDNPVNNSILTCCGHNFILEKNDCAIHFWGRTHSPVVRDNDISTACFSCDSRLRSGYGRFENNRYDKSVDLGRCDPNRRTDTWDFVISGLEFDGAKGDKAPNFTTGAGGRLVACMFKNMQAKVGNAFGCTFENCTGEYYPGGRWVETTVVNCKFKYFYGENVFTRCHIKDSYFQGFKNGHLSAKDGEFVNCQFRNIDTCDFKFDGTTFVNTDIANGYWEKSAKMKFDRCKITTPEKTPFLTTALYTVGKYAFDGCTIDGPRELVHIGDLRPQPTDTEPGYIGLRDCIWNATAKTAVTRSGDKVSPKQLYFVDQKNKFPKGMSMVDAKLPPTWTMR